jgi:Arc/MetJ-type ribon-helix-helix transcriptional regulator
VVRGYGKITRAYIAARDSPISRGGRRGVDDRESRGNTSFMATPNATMELPEDFQEQAEEWVRAGRFRSVQDAALAALSLLQEQERARHELRGQIDDALARYERGELEELEDGEFSAWLDSQ